MTKRPIALLLPIALLASCGEEAPVETPPDEGREAMGEVLGGTISDDMLPLDTVRSQSPPLREASEDSTTGAAPGDVAAPEDDETPGATTSEPEPPAPPEER